MRRAAPRRAVPVADGPVASFRRRLALRTKSTAGPGQQPLTQLTELTATQLRSIANCESRE